MTTVDDPSAHTQFGRFGLGQPAWLDAQPWGRALMAFELAKWELGDDDTPQPRVGEGGVEEFDGNYSAWRDFKLAERDAAQEEKAKKEALQRKAARERQEAERRRGGGDTKAKGGSKKKGGGKAKTARKVGWTACTRPHTCCTGYPLTIHLYCLADVAPGLDAGHQAKDPGNHAGNKK